MPTPKNRHGLSRYIPDPVKLLVRQQSGFGCVICGMGIYDYEHIIPDFADATFHDPEGITLLCPNHHAQKTRNIMPASEIKKAMKAPFALSKGFTFGPLYYEGGPIQVSLGSSKFIDTPYPIIVSDIPMISVTRPLDEGGPVSISSIMASVDGTPMLSINNNEWSVSTSKWDIKTVANKLTIKNNAKNVGLRFRNEPGHGIIFEAMRVGFAGLRIEINEDGDMIVGTVGSNQPIATFKDIRATSCHAGIMYGLPPELRAAAQAWLKTQGAFFGLEAITL